MTDAGPLDQIQNEDSDSDDLLPPTLAGGAAGESGLPGTGAWSLQPQLATAVLPMPMHACVPFNGSLICLPPAGAAVQAGSARPSSARATCRCHPPAAAGQRPPQRGCCCTGGSRGRAAAWHIVYEETRHAVALTTRAGTPLGLNQTDSLVLLTPQPTGPLPACSVDESLVFDPTDLAEDVTPAAALKALGQVGLAGGRRGLLWPTSSCGLVLACR